MDAQVFELLKILLAGGLVSLVTALTMSWQARRTVARDDRKQRADEATGAANAAKAITDAAGVIVKLQDDQVDEFKQQIRALQAEVSALNTRQDLEIQKRMRAEAMSAVRDDRIKELENRLAAMGAQIELSDKERQRLVIENEGMSAALYKLALGVQTLTRQLVAAKIEPAYTLDVPVTATGRLGALDVEAVSRYTEAH